MKKRIITFMLLAFISIASVSNTYAADHHHHHHHHGPHGHGHDGR